MKINWLIEDFTTDNNFDALAVEARNQGHNVQVLKFNKIYTSDDNFGLKDEDCVLFQGSFTFGNEILRKKKWIPGCWLNKGNYECNEVLRAFRRTPF